MLALFGLIPGVLSVIQSVSAAIFNAQVQITMARLQCDRDTAVARINAVTQASHDAVLRLQAIAGSTLLSWLVVAFATPLALLYAKEIVWDTMLGLGSTDALRGQLLDWSNAIIYSVFGSSTAVVAASLWSRK